VIFWRCCDLITPVPIKRGEPCCMSGDICVSDRELHITLAPLSSPHRTRAAQALCEVLNETAAIFPASRLRMRLAVRPPPRVGLAFPGSPVERSTTTVVPAP
jgi:hypothetical protein